MQAQGGGEGGAGSVYRGLRSRRTSSMLGEINVTPLVDVVLVLLLIFMVTAPMMSRGIDVSLPVANQPQIPQEDRITVSVRADGRVFVGDQVVNVVLLEERLRGLTSGRPDRARTSGRSLPRRTRSFQATAPEKGSTSARR